MPILIDTMFVVGAIAGLIIAFYFLSKAIGSSVNSAVTLTTRSQRTFLGALFFLVLVVAIAVVITAGVVSAMSHC
jgi:hypothetical protein